MIYLELFFTFFCIGAVCFGGGYAMISLMKDMAISHGWLTEGELLNMIAVSESTPGPIAVNMATFIGSSEAGVPGALAATLGVVLPSFIIILLIASLFRNFLKYRGVSALLSGIRPAIPALIIGTGITMLLSVLFGFKSYTDQIVPDLGAIIIFLIIAVISPIIKLITRKKPSPIVLILISAGLGIIVYYAAELI
ncbi:MAG: chromate transporter [Clostridia bacterium]|nr:chromate transporter [Clostridia bacterium]